MTILDVCAYLGLAAVGMATLNMGLGLLIALRYSPVRLWPHRPINIFRIHSWTAYLVLLLIVLHPAVLLFKGSTRFGFADVLLPIQSPVPHAQYRGSGFALRVADRHRHVNHAPAHNSPLV